jgi:hypothetical protein
VAVVEHREVALADQGRRVSEMSTILVAIGEMTGTEQIEAIQYARNNSDWLPANGGTETPFTSRSGIRMLYCWQPSTGHHAFLNCNTDVLMSGEEADEALCLK